MAQLPDAHLVEKEEQAVGGRHHGCGYGNGWFRSFETGRNLSPSPAPLQPVRSRVRAVSNQLHGRNIVELGPKAGAPRLRRSRSPGRSGRDAHAKQEMRALLVGFRVIATKPQTTQRPVRRLTACSCRSIVEPLPALVTNLLIQFIAIPSLPSQNQTVLLLLVESCSTNYCVACEAVNTPRPAACLRGGGSRPRRLREHNSTIWR